MSFNEMPPHMPHLLIEPHVAWQIKYEVWECGLLVFAEIYSVAVSLTIG